MIVHCLYFDHFVFIDCYQIDVQSEKEAAPFVEESETEPRQQGKQPPIYHVDKTQFPLILLCMYRMITLCRFLPHS